MDYLAENLYFKVPLTGENIAVAQKFSKLHKSPAKIRQVYLNTLAVIAVNFYCQCLEVETDLEASDSWQVSMQTLMDTADLEVKNWGKLECRPVLPGEMLCSVPAEAKIDRVGYVVVEIDLDIKEATILGFSPSAAMGELVIDELGSLEDLIDAMPEENLVFINLLDWFNNNWAAGWRRVEELLSPQLNPAFRGSDRQAAKLINLGLELSGHRVVLIVTICENDKNGFSLAAKVFPFGEQTFLPENLKFALLSENEEIIDEAIAERDEEFIQYLIDAELNDKFAVKVELGEASFIEYFAVQ